MSDTPIDDGFMQRMRRSSHLSGQNAAYIEALYETYLEDPMAIGDSWREYFALIADSDNHLQSEQVHSTIVQHFERLGRNRLKARPEKVATNIAIYSPQLGMSPPKFRMGHYSHHKLHL